MLLQSSPAVYLCIYAPPALERFVNEAAGNFCVPTRRSDTAAEASFLTVVWSVGWQVSSSCAWMWPAPCARCYVGFVV